MNAKTRDVLIRSIYMRLYRAHTEEALYYPAPLVDCNICILLDAGHAEKMPNG